MRKPPRAFPADAPPGINPAHIEKEAELTVATIPVDRKLATGFGIMHNDEDGRIQKFVEKPDTPELLDSLRLTGAQVAKQGALTDANVALHLPMLPSTAGLSTGPTSRATEDTGL